MSPIKEFYQFLREMINDDIKQIKKILKAAIKRSTKVSVAQKKKNVESPITAKSETIWKFFSFVFRKQLLVSKHWG